VIGLPVIKPCPPSITLRGLCISTAGSYVQELALFPTDCPRMVYVEHTSASLTWKHKNMMPYLLGNDVISYM
jgi:hypothetical protein